MPECLLDHRPDLIRRFGAEPENSGRLSHFCEIRILKSVAKSRMPAAFISSSTKASEPLLKTISLTGTFNWRSESKSPMSMANPPSPKGNDLAARMADLRADGLRQRIGHRAVVKDPSSRRLPFMWR